MEPELSQNEDEQIVVLSTKDIKSIIAQMITDRLKKSQQILKETNSDEGTIDREKMPIGYHVLTGEISSLRSLELIMDTLEEETEE